MKTTPNSNRNKALTRVEVLVGLGALGLLIVLFLTWCSLSRERNLRINCVFALKSIGLAYSVWAGDNHQQFPMEIPRANGGTMEFTNDASAFRHFQVMSNELSSPIVLCCPVDMFTEQRRSATNFANMNNSNISFFVGLNCARTNAQAILSGDRNITTKGTIENGVLNLAADQPTGWTPEIHKGVGNILLADATVLMVGSSDLQRALRNSNLKTNRLQMPILAP